MVYDCDLAVKFPIKQGSGNVTSMYLIPTPSRVSNFSYQFVAF